MKLWASTREMTNMDPQKKPMYASNGTAKANELNKFYMRFEMYTIKECNEGFKKN